MEKGFDWEKKNQNLTIFCRISSRFFFMGLQIFLFRGLAGLDSHRGQKTFSLPRVVPCFPLPVLSGLFMGLKMISSPI